MMVLLKTKLESLLAHKTYCARIAHEYDRNMAILNDENQPPLTMEVFREFGICNIKDLCRYLSKNAEYGGYVHFPWSDKLILLPFHNDFMNSWLRFDNPRVVELYDRLYENLKGNYKNRIHFDMTRFNLEEEIQLNDWIMPPLDRRMLAAPVNGCWDRPELIGQFLALQGYETRRLCVYDGIIMRGHCFTVYFDGKYWRTTSGFPINLKYKDYQKMCRHIYAVLRRVPIFKDKNSCRMIEFPIPHPGMNTREYIKNIERGKVVIPSKYERDEEKR